MALGEQQADEAGVTVPPADHAQAARPPTERRPRGLAALYGVVLGLLALGPFAFAVATPSAHVDTSAQETRVDAVPALPMGGQPATLSSALTDVPMLVEPPDDASEAALNAYRAADILEPDTVRAAFSSAWEAMAGTGATPEALQQAESQLLDPSGYDLPAGTDGLLQALAADPDNAGRLTNAAAMLFAYGVLLDSGIAETPRHGQMTYPFLGPAIETEARELLASVGRVFGPSAAQLVDQGVFTALTDYRTGRADGAALVGQALALQPDDVTVRLLLAQLQADQPDDPSGWEAAPGTLAPLLEDPGTALLGHAGLGDAYLLAASLRSLEAPRTARVLARRALAEYTAVLQQVSDPEVYAGWARAAELLGHTDEARRAVRRARELAPDPLAFAFQAASLAEAAGDAQEMRTVAEQALATTSAGWDPAVSSVRFVPGVSAYLSGFAQAGDLGPFGAGLGSSRDWLAVIRMPQGGGLLADVQVVPRLTDPERDQWRRSGFAPDVAALTALQASIDLGDPGTAQTDYDTWNNQPITTSKELVDEVSAELRKHVWAAQVVSDGAMPSDAVDAGETSGVFNDVDSTLRRAGAFARLEQVCSTLATQPADDSGGYNTTPDDARQCVGDARVLQGDREGAVAAYSDAIRAYDGSPPAALLIRRGATLHALHPGSADGRADLLRAATSDAEDNDVASAFLQLAGDDLDAGQVAVAEAHYDLALGLLDIDRVDGDDQNGRSLVRQSWVQALTNRGVARLRLAQGDPQQPPDCTSKAQRAECAAAAADFDAALAIDPLNPITLMDRAWVARSSGKTAAARAALTGATRADPSLYPAWNDLGVLEARAGDTDAARRAFGSALAASPHYALGWWNLGVLELRSGASGLRPGQADLARAISLDDSLAGAQPEYRTDEAVYKATFGGLEEVSSSWPVSRTYGLGAAVLGGIGLIAALGRLFRTFLSGLWESLTGVLVQRSSKARGAGGLGRLAATARSRVPRLLGPWVPWLAVGAVLATVTTLSAALRDPSAVIPTLVAVTIATASALAVHVLAHAALLRRHGGWLVADQWTGGIVLAVLMLPLQASTGPYLGERVDDAPKERLVRIHAAGPIANLALAAVAYGWFVVHPLPMLALTSQVSLAVAAYTLLPNDPLDGKTIVDRHPLLAAVLTLLVGAAGAAFAVGAA